MGTEPLRSILTYLERVKARLGALPGVASCEIHRGRFALTEVAQQSFRVPALRLAVMGLGLVTPCGDGARDVPLRLSLALVTRDADVPREVAAHALIDALAVLLPQETWGLGTWVHPATDVKGANLFSGEVDRARILLWEITWSQTLMLGDNAYPDGPILSGKGGTP